MEVGYWFFCVVQVRTVLVVTPSDGLPASHAFKDRTLQTSCATGSLKVRAVSKLDKNYVRLIITSISILLGGIVSVDIPCSGQNPKILGRDDTEVIRYLITIAVPFSGHLLAQKGQDRRFEIGECGMTSIVGDMLVHQAP